MAASLKGEIKLLIASSGISIAVNYLLRFCEKTDLEPVGIIINAT